MHRPFILSLLLFFTPAAYSQPPIAPPEADPFILKGYEALDYQAGDLNGDKKADAILVLKQPGEDSLMEEEPVRPLLILIRQTDGKLKQVFRNDSAILCRHCGGVFGDPYEGVSIQGNSFSISFYGGSNWRWASTHTFSWKPAKKNWYLVKEYETSYHTSDPNHPTKDATIEEAEMGEILFQNFNAEPTYEDSKWKVKVAKTYFYGNPKLTSKPRKAYLLKGNTATGIRQLKNFIEVDFQNEKGDITSGYILRKDLEPVK